jgi:hypothetical protein
MNDDTATHFQGILDSIERLKQEGMSDGLARFQALTKLIAMLLARQDYIEAMVEFLIKEKTKVS